VCVCDKIEGSRYTLHIAIIKDAAIIVTTAMAVQMTCDE